MYQKKILIALAILFGAVAAGTAISAQDRYTLTIPRGLAFSEFKGYETWQIISLSHHGDKLAAILGNSAMIKAYEAGIPENGKPFPDGAKMPRFIGWPRKWKPTPASR